MVFLSTDNNGYVRKELGMKFVLLLAFLVVILSSCTTQYSYILEEAALEFQFLTEENIPVENVRASCSSAGGKEYLSKALAEDLSEEGNTSNTEGLLVLRHKNYRDGGAVTSFGGFEWGQTSGPEVICQFYKGDNFVHSVKVDFFNNFTRETIRVKSM